MFGAMRVGYRGLALGIACWLVLGGRAWSQQYQYFTPSQPVQMARVPDQATPTGEFLNRVYTDAAGDHKYVLFVPAGYTSAKKWPVIMHLHGASSRGSDGRAQLVSGLASAIRLRPNDFPFLVVFPQSESTGDHLQEGWGAETADTDRALRILDSVEREYNVDRRREVLSGQSMGGTGVWEVASRTPERWAALVCVAGKCRPELIPRIAKIPSWSFHSTEDWIISIDRELVPAIRNAGGRAFLSEVPGSVHDISSLTFTQRALVEWMLAPSRDPQVNLEWTQPAGYSSGLDEEIPFVPGAEISQALQLRVCNDILESEAYVLPEIIAAHGLARQLPGVHRSAQFGPLPFDISLNGLVFRGEVERARLTTQAPDQLLIQLGLRNVIVTVSNTQVNGRLFFEASAGPMHVVIGHRAPVWMSVAVRPYVENRRLKLGLAGVNFQIPANNWYVTEPDVRVRAMPLLKGRISDGMVNGVYSRKAEIERQVMALAPRIVQQVEARIDQQLSKTVAVGQIPFPLWQMRLQFWPERVAIDDHGISLSVGVTMGALGYPDPGFRMRKYPAAAEQLQPVATGMEVAVNPAVVAAWSELIVAGHVNTFNSREFSPVAFQKLADREFLQEVIPDLKRYGDQLETNADFVLMRPFCVGTVEQPADTAPDDKRFSVTFPQLRVVASMRRPGEQKWTPCVNFDVFGQRDYLPAVFRGPFAARATQSTEASEVRLAVQADFAPGYEPQDRTIDSDLMKSQMMAVREGINQMGIGKPTVAKDIALAKVPWRLESFSFTQGHLVFWHKVPPIRISNGAAAPIEYEVRGPLTGWSQPRTLNPGQYHDYFVPYALTCRRRLPSATEACTVPLGKHVSFRDASDSGLVFVEDKLDFRVQSADQHQAALEPNSPNQHTASAAPPNWVPTRVDVASGPQPESASQSADARSE